MTPDHKSHVIDDYETLRDGYRDGIWVVENNDAVDTLTSILADVANENSDQIDLNHNASLDGYNDAIDDLGLRKIHTLADLQAKLTGN